MSEYEELTVTFKYIEGDEFRQWFEKEINNRICAVEQNQNKQIQVTGWALGDALRELHVTKGNK